VTLGNRPQVEEILHSAVGHIQYNHGVKLFRNHGLDGISKKPWAFRAEESGVRDLDGTRGDHITEANVDLKREPGIAKATAERQPDAAVLGSKSNGLPGDGSGVEADAVVLDFDRHAVLHYRDELRDACALAPKEIDVLGRPRGATSQGFECQRSLQNESPSVRGARKAVQKPLHSVIGKELIERPTFGFGLEEVGREPKRQRS
jgi:hypothetical protein